MITKRYWHVSGHVIDIDKENGMIYVWIRGFGNGSPAWIPILRSMPEWMLKPDESFEADIPFEERYQQELKHMTLINFIPMEYGDLSTEELFDLVSKLMTTF